MFPFAKINLITQIIREPQRGLANLYVNEAGR